MLEEALCSAEMRGGLVNTTNVFLLFLQFYLGLYSTYSNCLPSLTGSALLPHVSLVLLVKTCLIIE
jgi:hypothetical protein